MIGFNLTCLIFMGLRFKFNNNYIIEMFVWFNLFNGFRDTRDWTIVKCSLTMKILYFECILSIGLCLKTIYHLISNTF